jgi:hypothetical protein
VLYTLTTQVRILDELDRSSARGSPVTVLSTTKAPASELEAFEVSSLYTCLLQLLVRTGDACCRLRGTASASVLSAHASAVY